MQLFLADELAPVLIGPGSIHVAHTDREFISKKQLHEAVDLYCAIARHLVEGKVS